MILYLQRFELLAAESELTSLVFNQAALLSFLNFLQCRPTIESADRGGIRPLLDWDRVRG